MSKKRLRSLGLSWVATLAVFFLNACGEQQDQAVSAVVLKLEDSDGALISRALSAQNADLVNPHNFCFAVHVSAPGFVSQSQTFIERENDLTCSGDPLKPGFFWGAYSYAFLLNQGALIELPLGLKDARLDLLAFDKNEPGCNMTFQREGIQFVSGKFEKPEVVYTAQLSELLGDRENLAQLRLPTQKERDSYGCRGGESELKTTPYLGCGPNKCEGNQLRTMYTGMANPFLKVRCQFGTTKVRILQSNNLLQESICSNVIGESYPYAVFANLGSLPNTFGGKLSDLQLLLLDDQNNIVRQFPFEIQFSPRYYKVSNGGMNVSFNSFIGLAEKDGGSVIFSSYGTGSIAAHVYNPQHSYQSEAVILSSLSIDNSLNNLKAVNSADVYYIDGTNLKKAEWSKSGNNVSIGTAENALNTSFILESLFFRGTDYRFLTLDSGNTLKLNDTNVYTGAASVISMKFLNHYIAIRVTDNIIHLYRNSYGTIDSSSHSLSITNLQSYELIEPKNGPGSHVLLTGGRDNNGQIILTRHQLPDTGALNEGLMPTSATLYPAWSCVSVSSAHDCLRGIRVLEREATHQSQKGDLVAYGWTSIDEQKHAVLYRSWDSGASWYRVYLGQNPQSYIKDVLDVPIVYNYGNGSGSENRPGFLVAEYLEQISSSSPERPEGIHILRQVDMGY